MPTTTLPHPKQSRHQESLSENSESPHALPRAAVLRRPAYYGWWMLPVAMAIMVASSPGQTFCVTYFNEHLRAALSLSQTRLALLYMIATLAAAVPLPAVGALVDRWGLRRSTFLVAALFGLACVAMSQVSGQISLVLVFFAMRTLGPGALVLLSNNTLAAWFHRWLSTVSGANSFVMSIAMGSVPWLVLALISQFGWRLAYVVLGAAVWIVLLPVLAVMFRNRPDDIGQTIDGTDISQAEASVATPDLSLPARQASNSSNLNDQGMTLSDACRELSFWLLLIGMSVWTMIGTGIVFVIVPLFEAQGMSAQHAAFAFTLLTIGQASMQIGGGVLERVFSVRRMLCGAMAAMAISAAALALGDRNMILPAFVIYGMGQGAMTIVGGTSWAQYFGRKHLGKIRGTSMTAAVGGSSLGPVVLGVSLDQFGGFGPGMWLFAALATAMALAAPFALPPKRL